MAAASAHPCLLGLALLLFGCLSSAARTVPALDALRPADAIVVLGHRPARGPDGAIEPELRARMDAGIRLYRRHLAPRLVLAGGPDPRAASSGERGEPEAEVMREYALGEGVAAAAITLEAESHTTVENAQGVMRLLCPQGPCFPRVIVVTSPYHLARARRLFECAARVQGFGSAFPNSSAALARERLVEVGYGAVDVCRRVRN